MKLVYNTINVLTIFRLAWTAPFDEVDAYIHVHVLTYPIMRKLCCVAREQLFLVHGDPRYHAS